MHGKVILQPGYLLGSRRVTTEKRALATQALCQRYVHITEEESGRSTTNSTQKSVRLACLVAIVWR